MYTGFILWIFGWVLAFGAGVSAFAGLACIGDVLFWRYLEENQLAAAYGTEYKEYRKQTWF
jgi:protein-S-isoprenylcysteine O-methyltransferase Ste14